MGSKDFKILIVDDEFVACLLLRSILEREGYTVTDYVSTGDKALESVANNRPNLVIMDILINGKMNGIETVREIQKIDNIPVIFITGYGEEEIVDEAKSLNPINIFSKPYNQLELLETIEKLQKKI